MTLIHSIQQLSIGIERPFETVNDFLAQPENFPKWASGLGKDFQLVDGEWVVNASEGAAKVRFTPKNDFGVIDHWVSSPNGDEVYIPLRVIHNGEGSEVLLTLFHLPTMTPDKFAEDAEWVKLDLMRLKTLLEAQGQ
jgi:hypothetical protein